MRRIRNAAARAAATVACLALLCAAAGARAVQITFDELAPGTVLGSQYAALGVTFSADGFAGPNANSTAQGWATNTDMTIVSTTGADVGALGAPGLVGGNLLHAFSGWLAEDGDPSFAAAFAVPVTSFAVDLAGVSEPGDSALFVFDGPILLSTVTGPQMPGQFTLGYAAASITRVVVAAGSFSDWVGVDNIRFTPLVQAVVPAPATAALMGAGLAGLAGAALRRPGRSDGRGAIRRRTRARSASWCRWRSARGRRPPRRASPPAHRPSCPPARPPWTARA